jgi:hypothetical protein
VFYIGIIALLVVVFFRESLFQKKVFLVPDNISFTVWNTYRSQAEASGVATFWNPYIFCGMPGLGTFTPGYDPRDFNPSLRYQTILALVAIVCGMFFWFISKGEETTERVLLTIFGGNTFGWIICNFDQLFDLGSFMQLTVVPTSVCVAIEISCGRKLDGRRNWIATIIQVFVFLISFAGFIYYVSSSFKSIHHK